MLLKNVLLSYLMLSSLFVLDLHWKSKISWTLKLINGSKILNDGGVSLTGRDVDTVKGNKSYSAPDSSEPEPISAVLDGVSLHQ